MKDQQTFNEPRDTSPLELDQLSDDELVVILEIEQRLREARSSALDRPLPERKRSHYPSVQVRHPRVLLLDGGRGTGKTSLLLTMAHAWAPGDACEVQKISEAPGYAKRVAALRPSNAAISHDAAAPDFVRVIGRILDFDPLPASMPLIAGIVQAWRPLVDHYDSLGGPQSCHDDEKSLKDRWHELFRIAAVGWSPIPQGQGLVEQVLDREEQVENWHSLDAAWQQFIDHVIECGRCLKKPHKLPGKPIFVIMIDDVDLQVGRISELLPALRLLYHPNVVFMVAADEEHMIDMLKLDFLGQQNKLAAYRNGNGASLELADQDRYATRLATSAVEKVFQLRNRWRLEWLSLRDFLVFPHHSARDCQGVLTLSFRDILSGLSPGEAALESYEIPEVDHSADRILDNLAGLAQEMELPALMTFRSAHQLYQFVVGQDPELQAFRVLERLLSGNENGKAALSRSPSDTEPRSVYVDLNGELAAIFRPSFRVAGTAYSLVFGTRPDFVFLDSLDRVSSLRMSQEPYHGFNFLAAIIGKTLEEYGFPVKATGLRWENYLSLAWTEWQQPRQMSFPWDVIIHPRPDKLLEQASEWSEVMRNVQHEPQDRYVIDRYAYAWAYCQRKWNGYDISGLVSPEDVLAESDFPPWGNLLGVGSQQDDEAARTLWQRSMQKLARPELGLSPESTVQLLGVVEPSSDVRRELQIFRLREISDALFVSGLQRGEVLPELLSLQQEIKIAQEIDRMYEDQFGFNPWQNVIGFPESEVASTAYETPVMKSRKGEQAEL